jgi:hypothetical protein
VLEKESTIHHGLYVVNQLRISNVPKVEEVHT